MGQIQKLLHVVSTDRLTVSYSLVVTDRIFAGTRSIISEDLNSLCISLL